MGQIERENMKRKNLFPYSFKTIRVKTKKGHIFEGVCWRYYRDDSTMRDGDYIYYIGYDGGMMVEVKPSEILEIEEIK